MRKLLITAAIIIFTITVSNSQGIRYGIKGGLNFSSLGVPSSIKGIPINTDKITSFNIGGFMEFPLSNLSKKLYGQIGLNYSNNGAKITARAVLQKLTMSKKVKIHQLNLPVFLKYQIVNNLFINGGGYLGGLSSDLLSSRIKFDAGLLIGAEYNLKNGLLFFANYNYGLANIAGNLLNKQKIKVKNRVFQIGLGYKF